MHASSKAPAGSVVAYPSAANGWYVVFVLYLAYTFAFIDRQIMAFLVTPIRKDFAITDFQFSLISGLAFGVFYATLGIPIARLADVHSRRNIIAAGIGTWSLMTALCGLTASYWQLFLARLGVGVGEATLSPSAISLIADYFPKEKRALPINIYAAGVHGGAGFANIFGGYIVFYAMTGGGLDIALLGSLKPWQMAFVLVGLPGLLVALLTFTIREPARHEQRRAAGSVSFPDVVRYLRRHWLVYSTLMIGAALTSLASYGTFSWVPALFERRYGWNTAQIGLHIGLITLVFGTGGLVASGIVAGRMVRANKAAPYTRIMITLMAGTILPAALIVAIDDPYWTLVCLTLMICGLSAPIGLVQAALQAITPNEMRAQVIAVYLLCVTLLGLALGPAAVAAVTDYYFGNDAAVGSSMAIVASSASALSVIFLLLGIGAYQRKVQADD